VFRSLVEEAGAVWASDVHELLELAKTLAIPTAIPDRPGLAIMTCSGGDSAQGADEAARCGIELPGLSPATRARLEEQLPDAATVANPLDYTAVIWGDSAALGELVRTVGEDPAIGQVLVFYDELPGIDGAAEESWRAVREGIIAGAEASPVPTLVSSTLPELLDDDSAWRFIQAGVPAAAGLRTGVRCAAAMRFGLGDPARLNAIAAAAREARRATSGASDGWLAEHEAKELLRAAGVSVVDGRVVRDAEDAVIALGELGGSVAMKVSSAAVQHKSELGGVALGLTDRDEVRLAFDRLKALGGAVLAERMCSPGVELIVAARSDGVVPALILGLGGIWTELLDDVQVVPLPAAAPRIERALRSLRGAALLSGGRGRSPVDVAAVARIAERVGGLLLERSLALIELNPVLASEAGAVVVDATMRFPRHEEAACTT
jgi:acetyl-CoA synthetase